MKATALEVENMTCGYGNAMILRDLSMKIISGESVSVLGKNGMGKSTLLKAIMGFLPKARGSVRIFGFDTTKTRPHNIARHGIAYAAQEQPLFTDLTVRNNLEIALKHPETFEQLFRPITHLFPVFAKRLDQPAGTLSGGEQKMLLVARCLMLRPSFILLDEITEGLQPLVIDNIAEALKWERESHGTTMLIIEQNIQFALKVTDRFQIMSKGSLVDSGCCDEDGAADKILRHLSV